MDGKVVRIDNIKVKLSKPYTFEGETFTEIDLTGLHDLKARDIAEIDKIFVSKGGNPAYAGLTLEYAIIIANRVTGKPLEFFEGLPPKAAIQLKNEVISFFYTEE